MRTTAYGFTLVLAGLLVGFCWAISSPVGSSPDDDYHMTAIWCPPPIDSSGCTEGIDPTTGASGVQLPESIAAEPCYARDAGQSAACLEDEARTDVVASPRVRQGLYPGPYYRIMHLLVGDDVARSVVMMRFANVVLAAGLICAVAALGTPDTRRLAAYSVLGTGVPLGVFLIASVNPSSWAIVGVTVSWLSGHGLLLARSRGRALATGTLMIVGAAVAAASRGDAGAYVALACAALLVLHGRTVLRQPTKLLVIAGAVGIGLWSFLLARQTGVLTQGFAEVDTAGRPAGAVLFVNLTEFPGLVAGVFGIGPIGGLGWLDTRVPFLTSMGMVAVAAGLVFVGLSVTTDRKLLALGLVALGITIPPLVVLSASLNVVGEAVQPRYVLPLVPLLIGVSLVGACSRRTISLRRAQTATMYVLVVAAHSLALHANLRRYVTGQDVGGASLDRGLEWWWRTGPQPMTVWILGSSAFAILALTLFSVRDDSDDSPVGVTGAGDRHV